MNEEQRDKLSQALLEESLLCANRNDIEESIELVQMSVSVKWHHTIKKIIDGDRKLLEKVMNDQFSSNKVEVIKSDMSGMKADIESVKTDIKIFKEENKNPLAG